MMKAKIACRSCKVSYLRKASLFCPGRDLVGVSLQHPPVLLTVLLVFSPGVAFPQRPVHTHLQRLLQVSGVSKEIKSFHSKGQSKSEHRVCDNYYARVPGLAKSSCFLIFVCLFLRKVVT